MAVDENVGVIVIDEVGEVEGDKEVNPEGELVVEVVGEGVAVGEIMADVEVVGETLLDGLATGVKEMLEVGVNDKLGLLDRVPGGEGVNDVEDDGAIVALADLEKR